VGKESIGGRGRLKRREHGKSLDKNEEIDLKERESII
jgi:hypothetical protein